MIFKLSRFFPSLPALTFFTPLPGFFAAQLPNDAAGAKFAVKAGVGAGAADVQAFLAVAELHLLADHAGLPVRVKTAFIHKNIIIHQSPSYG